MFVGFLIPFQSLSQLTGVRLQSQSCSRKALQSTFARNPWFTFLSRFSCCTWFARHSRPWQYLFYSKVWISTSMVLILESYSLILSLWAFFCCFAPPSGLDTCSLLLDQSSMSSLLPLALAKARSASVQNKNFVAKVWFERFRITGFYC